MNLKNRTMTVLATLLSASLLFACGGNDAGDPDLGRGEPQQEVRIAIVPAERQLRVGSGERFNCVVTGSDNTACTWRIEGGGGGTINAGGEYTAPAAPGVFRLTATSAADTSKRASATVTVTTAPSAAKPWVTGYYAGWFWDQMYPPEKVDMSAMTHFVFGRVAPGAGSGGGVAGQVVPMAGTAHEPRLAPGGVLSVENYLIRRAHDAGIKALLMLGGDGADGDGFLASTAAAVRPTFVRNVVDYLVQHDYDGVDVDWENQLGTARAQQQLIALIDELRTEANSRARYRAPNAPVLITFPGYALNINYARVEPWQVTVASKVDQYNLMSYGIGSTWNGAGWHSWFSSPIFGASGTTPIDLASSIQMYVDAGVPRNRMGIGIGFYGIYFGPTITGPRQSTRRNNIYEVNDVALRYSHLLALGYLDPVNAIYHWDEEAQSSYMTYRDSGGYIPPAEPGLPPRNPAGFLSYEDENSIAAKGAWVRDSGVGGTILWTINYGYLPATQRNPLLEAVKASFLD